MGSLDPPQAWQPDSNAALDRFHTMRREAAVARRHRLWALGAAVAACVAVGAFLPGVLPSAKQNGAPVLAASFRVAGSASAPIVAEIYSDYQCVPCARLMQETMPRLVTDYVETGKVRLLHRDLPLPQHPYAREAARYANAAGRIGRYGAAADVLFRSQREWAADGNIESRLSRGLPSADMGRLREALQHREEIEAAIDADIEMAQRDDVRVTPTMVVVANGKRRTVAPVPPYAVLKTYLDEELKINCRENPGAAKC